MEEKRSAFKIVEKDIAFNIDLTDETTIDFDLTFKDVLSLCAKAAASNRIPEVEYIPVGAPYYGWGNELVKKLDQAGYCNLQFAGKLAYAPLKITDLRTVPRRYISYFNDKVLSAMREAGNCDITFEAEFLRIIEPQYFEGVEIRAKKSVPPIEHSNMVLVCNLEGQDKQLFLERPNVISVENLEIKQCCTERAILKVFKYPWTEEAKYPVLLVEKPKFFEWSKAKVVFGGVEHTRIQADNPIISKNSAREVAYFAPGKRHRLDTTGYGCFISLGEIQYFISKGGILHDGDKVQRRMIYYDEIDLVKPNLWSNNYEIATMLTGTKLRLYKTLNDYSHIDMNEISGRDITRVIFIPMIYCINMRLINKELIANHGEMELWDGSRIHVPDISGRDEPSTYASTSDKKSNAAVISDVQFPPGMIGLKPTRVAGN